MYGHFKRHVYIEKVCESSRQLFITFLIVLTMLLLYITYVMAVKLA